MGGIDVYFFIIIHTLYYILGNVVLCGILILRKLKIGLILAWFWKCLIDFPFAYIDSPMLVLQFALTVTSFRFKSISGTSIVKPFCSVNLVLFWRYGLNNLVQDVKPCVT